VPVRVINTSDPAAALPTGRELTNLSRVSECDNTGMSNIGADDTDNDGNTDEADSSCVQETLCAALHSSAAPREVN
jgi:hypothetical protein